MRFKLDPSNPNGISEKVAEGYQPYFAGGTGKPSLLDSVNGKHGAVQITGGTNVTVDNTGTDIVIAATGSEAANGVPAGGTTGQILAKNSDTDYDTEWIAAASGSGAVDSVNGATGTVVLDQDDVLDGTTYKQYSATEKTKLAGIATSATANSSDATLLARANHTGTQTASTISDFNTAVDTRVALVVDSAPATLDTLNELAAALGDDANYAATVTTALGTKAPLASPALTGSPTAPTQTAGDNSTKIATTAYVETAVSGVGGGGTVGTVVAGTNIDVDATDPANPIVSLETLTVADISDITASAAELNVLDGVTASTTELNYTDGVTSGIQSQLDGKAATSHTHGIADLTATGTPSSSTYLRGDGTWSTPAGGGSGDVVGPASATDNAVARFDLTTGKLVQDSSNTIDDNGNLTTGKLFKIDATTGNPEFDFTESGTVRSKTYYDVTNNRLTFQNNEVNTQDAIYFTDHVTTTGNITVGTASTSAGSVATIDGTQTLTNKTLTSPVINAPTGFLTGAAKITVGTSTPGSPSVGDIWIDSN